MSLSVQLVTSGEQLSTDEIAKWNQLAQNPLQRWEWLGSWWEAYQSKFQLFVLKVMRDNQVIAFAPWCIENRLSSGKTIQFLGSGKACTDHLSLLVNATDRDLVCQQIAGWLANAVQSEGQSSGADVAWDSIEWIGVDQDDETINCLVESMRDTGLAVEQSEGLGCYSIDLPSDWDEYVSMRSKSGRREIRQSLKNIDNESIIVTRIEDQQQLSDFWDQFILLHQRRRHASGTTGCFDHPPFGTFLRNAAERLLDAGLLQFIVATADGNPVAAQFAVADQDGWYFYQSGMEPDASDLRPGLSVFCYAIRQSILTGRSKFDMMRGDEPYKLRWRAKLNPAQEIRVCSPRATAQIRKRAYNVGLTFKHLVKSGLGLVQQSDSGA